MNLSLTNWSHTKKNDLSLWKSFFFFVSLFVFSGLPLHAQENGIQIKGIVTDAAGVTLPGATVQIKGQKTGTVTDVEGNFQMNAPQNATLVFSYIGYLSQEQKASENMKIVLQEDLTELEDVVVIGYGTQKKVSITASVSTLKTDQLINAPTANISNALGGRVAGLITAQTSGEPGKDGAEIHIRGVATNGKSEPLMIVDGIPRDFTRLDPNTIESFSILKDAAAVAPYGMAGANGVILVTTKKGKQGKTEIAYNGSVGYQNPTKIPSMLNAYEYVTMRNAAQYEVLPDKSKLPYQETDVEEYLKTVQGAPDAIPDRYPNSNPMNDSRNKNTLITSHSVSLSGGNDKIRFFTSLGVNYQEGLWSTSNSKRYNLTSNIDIDATKTTTVSLSINGWNQLTSAPAYGAAGIFAKAQAYLPIHAVRYSNGLIGNSKGESFLALAETGYDKNDYFKIMTQLTINQKLNFIKGLEAKVVLGYDPAGNHQKNWSTPKPTYYDIDLSTDPYTYKPIVDNSLSSLSERNERWKDYMFQGMLNYANVFGKHSIAGLFLIESKKATYATLGAGRTAYEVDIPEINMGSSNSDNWSNSGSSSKATQIGYMFRGTYNYDTRYLAEISGRYDGHYYFAPGHKFGFFPAASLGWRISEESFIKDNLSFVNNLKLRASWGKSGNLAGNPFQYSTLMGIRGNVYVIDGVPVMGLYERLEPNPLITWEVAKKTDIGLDLSLWNGLLVLEADYFYEKRDNMLTSPGSVVPKEYGINLAQINNGEMENKGLDLLLSSYKTFANGFCLDVTATYTYAKNKILKQYENPATLNDPNRSRTGRSWGTQFGLLADRLFQQEDDKDGDGYITAADGFPEQKFGKVRPGDIKYVDVNGDGSIDGEDEAVIGRPMLPSSIFGLNIRASWKGFDAAIFIQGATGNDILITQELAFPFKVGGNAPKTALDYWTPENPNATYPRLYGEGGNTNNMNSMVSSWYMRKGEYVRLKNFEIGYSLKHSLLKNYAAIEQLRVYVSGQNLLTFDHLGDLFDPEVSSSAGDNTRGWFYPQQKVLSFGVNISF